MPSLASSIKSDREGSTRVKEKRTTDHCNEATILQMSPHPNTKSDELVTRFCQLIAPYPIKFLEVHDDVDEEKLVILKTSAKEWHAGDKI